MAPALPQAADARGWLREAAWLLQVLLEQVEGPPPGVLGGRLVVDVGPLVVEESVVRSRVDVDLHRLTPLLDGGLHLSRGLRGHERVLLREEAEHRPAQAGVVRTHVRMAGVEVDHRPPTSVSS